MGIFAIVLALLLLLLLLYCLLKTFAAKLKRFCQTITEKIKKILFFDGIIRYMIEGCLKITWTNLAVIGAVYIGFESSEGEPEDDFTIYVSMGFIAFVVFFIISTMVLLLVRRDRLQEETMIEKYGALYEDIDTERVLPAIYTSVFCLRRFTMILAVVYLKNEAPFAMLYAFLGIYTINYCYLVHAEANNERIMNWLEYMSEVSLIGLLYMMLFFI